VFIRQDLAIQQQLVQSVHATFEMSQKTVYEGDIPSVVLIGVPHQKALERVLKKLRDHSIEHSCFVEPDFDMGLSAVATIPLGPEQRSILKNYEPWKPEKVNALGK
jgi:hypothetical protein